MVFIERAPRLIRPLNFPKGTPGRGAALVDAKNGKRALVINAMGRIFMDPLDDPFAAVERELAACALKSGADAIVIDFHCEATSEKQAMGYFTDGRASLVVGTHTHAPTADDRILPAGTAFMSDVGMTADYNSIIGMNKDEPLNRFLRKLPGAKFEPSNGPATLCGLAVETDDATGLARKVGAVAARRYPAGGPAQASGTDIFQSARLTANRGDNSVEELIRRHVLGPASRPRHGVIWLSRQQPIWRWNCRRTSTASQPRHGRNPIRRAELAAQFIPAGARVFDLGASPALQTLLPNGCSYRWRPAKPARNAERVRRSEYPANSRPKPRRDADVIVMLGVLERIDDVESLFTHLRFCKRDIIVSCYPTDLDQKRSSARTGLRQSDEFLRPGAACSIVMVFASNAPTPVERSQMLMRLTPMEWLAPVAPAALP